MTLLGKKKHPIWRQTLNSDRLAEHNCPRTTAVFAINSRSTMDNPAVLCVPTSPNEIQGLTIRNVVMSSSSRAASSEATPTVVNICMRVMDDCGRPNGPIVTIAAAHFDNQRENSENREVAVSCSLSFMRGQRISLFVRQSPGDAHVEAVFVSVAHISDVEALQRNDRLRRSLDAMLKNSDVAWPVSKPEAEVECKANTTKEPSATSSRQSEHSSADRKRARSQSTTGAALTSEDSGAPPQLVYRLIPGGADES